MAKVKDVKPGQIKTVRAGGGYEIALANVDGRIYAFDAYCPHQRWPLKWGAAEGTTLVCGLHGWCFDLDTGTPSIRPWRTACRCTRCGSRATSSTWAIYAAGDGAGDRRR